MNSQTDAEKIRLLAEATAACIETHTALQNSHQRMIDTALARGDREAWKRAIDLFHTTRLEIAYLKGELPRPTPKKQRKPRSMREQLAQAGR